MNAHQHLALIVVDVRGRLRLHLKPARQYMARQYAAARRLAAALARVGGGA